MLLEIFIGDAMKVKDVIEKLQKMDGEKEIRYLVVMRTKLEVQLLMLLGKDMFLAELADINHKIIMNMLAELAGVPDDFPAIHEILE